MNEKRQTVQMGGLAGWVIAAIRRGRRNIAARKDQRPLELVETLSLGARRQLALVHCNGEHFLVGMGAESVTAIARIEGNTEFRQPPGLREDRVAEEVPGYVAGALRSNWHYAPKEGEPWDSAKSFPLTRPRGLSQRSEAGL